MKKQFTFIAIAVFFSTLSFGQFIETPAEQLFLEHKQINHSKNKINTYSRAARQRLDSNVIYSRSGGQRILFSKDEFIYNSNDQNTTVNSFNYVNGNWEPSTNESISYDSQGNITENWSKQYDTASNSWENSYRDTYQYNANNLLTQTLTERWVNNAWENNSKTVTRISGNVVTDTYKLNWNFSLQQWDSTHHLMQGYDNNGNENLRIYYNYTSGSWQESTKYEYFFNASNFKTSSRFYKWDGQWSILTRVFITPDANNNILTYTLDVWDNNQWNPAIRYTNLFDLNYTVNDLVTPYWYTDNNMWVNRLSEQFTGGVWVKSYSSLMFYSPQTISSISNPDMIEVNVYPNPATNLVNIQLPISGNTRTIEIYDMKGALVLKQTLNGNTLDISTLKKGAYYFMIPDNQKSYSGKLMKL